MSKPQQKTSVSNGVALKGNVKLEYFIVSKETLHRLAQCSASSKKYDLSIVFFELSGCILLTLWTTQIESRLLFTGLFAAASVSFAIGLNLYLEHRKNRKEVDVILNKIKRSHRAKCEPDTPPKTLTR